MRLIVEELTPKGSGAVSVLRVRGPDAGASIRGLCGGPPATPGALRRVDLQIDGEILDEALVCALPGGDYELHVHGSRAVVGRLIARLAPDPVAPAEARSIEAAAAEALAHAPCEAAARILLDQAEGALTRELRALSSATPEGREQGIDHLLSRWSVARRAFEAVEIVIVGPVNAGKSTLFNALVGEARAIVDPEPGTTRDRLRARAQLGAWPVWISDTAGERDLSPSATEASVEREGQERARRAAARADLVLRLERLDPSRASVGLPGRETSEREVRVHTFADLVESGSRGANALSALRDPEGARRRIGELFRSFFSLPAEPWTPGAGVPLDSEQARAISALRGKTEIEVQRAVEDVLTLGGGRWVPRSRLVPPAVAPEPRSS